MNQQKKITSMRQSKVSAIIMLAYYIVTENTNSKEKPQNKKYLWSKVYKEENTRHMRWREARYWVNERNKHAQENLIYKQGWSTRRWSESLGWKRRSLLAEMTWRPEPVGDNKSMSSNYNRSRDVSSKECANQATPLSSPFFRGKFQRYMRVLRDLQDAYRAHNKNGMLQPCIDFFF